jgi:hypothetical protein
MGCKNEKIIDFAKNCEKMFLRLSGLDKVFIIKIYKYMVEERICLK